MNCNLSRSQKAKANNYQKGVLSVISEHNKLLHEYGEFYVWLNVLKRLDRCGVDIFCGNKHEEAEFLGMCLLGECLRRIKLMYPKLNNSENTSKEYNTDNIYIGQSVSNYKELCRLLEVEPKTGKSRQLQERDFLRCFDYEKLKYSNEYFILDIYDTPLKKNEQAKNSLYCNALKVMIMYELAKARTKDNMYTIYTTLNKLINKLEILSIFFDKDIIEYLIDKYSELTQKDKIDIDVHNFKRKLSIFKTITKRKHKGNVGYALKRLKEQNMIHYESYSVIVEMIDGKKNYRQADFEEEKLIESAKKIAAKEIGYPNGNIASLYNPKEYHNQLSQIYNSYDWLYVYNQIEIGTNYNMLSTNINEYTNYSMFDFSVLDLSNNVTECCKKIYIENVVSSSLKKAEREHNERKQDIIGDTLFEYIELFGAPDSLLNDNDNELTLKKLFIKYFINPNEDVIAEYEEYIADT